MNRLSEWLKSKGFYSSADGTPNSHLTFDGKKVYVPASAELEFRKRYSNELAFGTPLYYIEVRTKVFRYMMDLDILDDHPWKREEFESIGRTVQKCVSMFYEEEHSMICCASPPKPKNGGIHTGIHLIWNDITSDSNKAIVIRHAVIKAIRDSGLKLMNALEDAVDELVYTRAGYRMVGSDKFTKGEPENRRLRLVYVMNPDGSLRETHYKRLLESTYDLIMETSIRCTDSSDSPLPIKIPAELRELYYKTVSASEEGKPCLGLAVTSELEHGIINEFINSVIPGYKTCIVKSVVRYPDQNLLVKTNSRFCTNVGREHNSCGIYFFASPRGVCQKCLCRCNNLVERKHGYCSSYSSKMYPFPDNIVKALFPDFIKEKVESRIVQIKTTKTNNRARINDTFNSLFSS